MNPIWFLIIGLIQGGLLAFAIREDQDKNAGWIMLISIIGTYVVPFKVMGGMVNIVVVFMFTYLNVMGGASKDKIYVPIISILCVATFALLII